MINFNQRNAQIGTDITTVHVKTVDLDASAVGETLYDIIEILAACRRKDVLDVD